jgi:hypothetical protein
VVFLENVIIDVDNGKSLLVQEEGETVRARNIFHVNEMMGGNYWLLDEQNNIKFKLNTNQVKVLKIAMAMVNPKEEIDVNKPPISYSFTIDKLLEIMGYSNNRLRYNDLPVFLDSLMLSDNFSYKDEKGNLYLMHIFDSVVYKPEKSEVTFRFSWSMLEKFLTIKDKDNGTYQSYMLGNIMGFDSLHSINLYELCKVKLKGVRQRNFEIDLLDLKIALDLYNKDKPEDEKYPRYYDFKKNVIDKCVNEINETSNIDIKISFIERRKGKSVKSIVFTVNNLNYTEKPKSVVEIDNNNEVATDIEYDYTNVNQDEIIALVRSIVTEEIISMTNDKVFTNDSCMLVYKIAKGNLEIIKEKVNIAVAQGGIDNIGKWLNGAIKHDYKLNPKAIKKNNSTFNNFEQRKYDGSDGQMTFDDLEQKLREASLAGL